MRDSQVPELGSIGPEIATPHEARCLSYAGLYNHCTYQAAHHSSTWDDDASCCMF